MAPRRQGVYRQEWDVCDRCGFQWPIGMLSMQLGRKVCPYDIDDISNYFREKIISEVQRQPEGQSDKGKVFRAPVDLQF